MPVYSSHKKARHEYEILETLEAGVELLGAEVKSVRNGQAKLAEAFVVPREKGLYLLNCHIPAYDKAPESQKLDPTRSRRLLVHKKELDRWRGKITENGLTAIPLSLYTKGRLIKAEIALVRGKKTYDKRAAKKKRDLERDSRRDLERL